LYFFLIINLLYRHIQLQSSMAFSSSTYTKIDTVSDAEK